MKPGDSVYFQDGPYRRIFTVVSLHEFEDSVTIRNGIRPMIVRKSEVVDREETDAAEKKAREDVKEAEARIRLTPVIDAWNSGLHSVSEIAKHLDEFPCAVGSKLRSAQRLGFIPNSVA